jgi:hypothetical protein
MQRCQRRHGECRSRAEHQPWAYWQALESGELQQQQTLQGEFCSEVNASANQPAFWMMVANEQARAWKWQDLYDKGRAFFREGSVQRNFADVHVGDIVFGYRARPHSQLIALAQVTEALHTEDENGTPQQGITIRPLGQQLLAHPVSWQKLRQDLVLRLSKPLRIGLRGTLFKLSD